MTEPSVRLLDAQEAMSNPTWALLRQGRAPVVLATVTPLLEQGLSAVPVADFHARAGRVFAVARERDAAFPVDPDDPRAVREECKSWVQAGRWLERAGEADGETYRLTPEAREAIDIVRRMSTKRAAMTESQVALVLDSARQLALKATANPEQRISALQEEIDDLEHKLMLRRAEMDRLLDGGPVEMVEDEDVLNDYLRLRDEIDRLPGDLKRVEDSYRDLVQKVRDEFLAETRPHGEVVGEYLQMAADLATSERYGRGFQQAKQLLTDDLLQARLQQDLARIIEHPFAATLSEREQAELRRTVHMIGDSVSGVLEQRRAMTKRLVAFISSRDSMRERELADGLRTAQQHLLAWARSHGPRASVHLPVAFWAEFGDDPDVPISNSGEVAAASIATFREKPRTARIPTAMESLADSAGTGEPEFSVEQLRSKGGPFYQELADAITTATTDGRAVGAADVFNNLPDTTRRPVDLHGLLNIATRNDALRPGMATVRYHAVRPDGEQVTYFAPDITFVADAGAGAKGEDRS